jgi:hypothetical protein
MTPPARTSTPYASSATTSNNECAGCSPNCTSRPMRNRARTTLRPPIAAPGAVPPNATRYAVLSRLVSPVRSVLEWLRSGYPDDAPRTGYSPLLALNGPIGLTVRQTEHVGNELHRRPTDVTDIAVAITTATHRLPTPSQVDAILAVLATSE